MCSEIFALYEALFKQYKLLHSQKSKDEATCDFNAIWLKAKAKHSSKEELAKFARNLLADYRKKTGSKEVSNYLPDSVARREPRMSEVIERIIKRSSHIPGALSEKSNESDENITDDSLTTSSSDTRKRKVVDDSDIIMKSFVGGYSTPAQDKLKKGIALLEAEIAVITCRKNSANANGTEEAEIFSLSDCIRIMKRKLHHRQQHIIRSRKYRRMIKLRCASSTGEKVPQPKEYQSALLKTIVDLALYRASEDEQRRCEILHGCGTLDSLHTALEQLGFNISRTDAYFRLVPTSHSKIEDKHRVSTAPVQLKRPGADREKAHPDEHFCASTVKSLESLASILGPNDVSFISQDDKARITIGQTAPIMQAPLLMRVEYRAPLPDNGLVTPAEHEFIPTVYAGCVIKDNAMDEPGAVRYSGPTYIAIRNGEHSSFTGSSHTVDLEKLTNLDNFRKIIRDENGRVKPIVMISSDGGPDPNPPYPKILANAIHSFARHDLDGLFMFVNAPGRSAFNRAERRLAPLSRQLHSVVLPYDSCGSHLDDQGRVVNTDLQKTNIRKVGKAIAELWNNVVLDGNDVVAEYIESGPYSERLAPTMPSEDWCSKHVQQSQYLLQVVKCNDGVCCRDHRSSLRCILPDGFLPIPFPIKQTPNGLNIPKPEEHDGKSFASLSMRLCLDLAPSHVRFTEIPYDMYCPSLWSEPKLLESRICKECGLYFWSNKAVAAHITSLHKETRKENNDRMFNEAESQDIEDVVMRNPLRNKNVVTFVSIEQNNTNPWVDSL